MIEPSPYSPEQTFEFPDLADGQAWVRDFGGDHAMVVLGDLTISYVDRTGATRTQSIPFQGEIPDYCHDDFFIEIDHNDQLHWGLLIYQNYRETHKTVFWTHTLTGATGLLLGWLVWRKGRGRTMRTGQPGKFLMPEL